MAVFRQRIDLDLDKMQTLANEIKKNIKEHALKFPTEEVCGIVIKDGQTIKILKSENFSLKKQNYFKLDPLLVIESELQGFEILAIYHSHPNKKKDFSLFDKINADVTNINLILYHNQSDSFNLYYPNKNPYLGRPFKLGECDCFSLVRDVFERELNIILKNIERTKYWIKKENIIDSNFKKMGFSKIKEGFVNNNELKEYDCIINKNDKFNFPSHILIYLGNNKVMHHVREGYSTITDYSGELKEKTLYVLRYNKFINE